MPVQLEKNFNWVRELVGDISADQLGNTLYAVTEKMGLFMPLTGPCEYAVTPNHSHPAHSFVTAFDDAGLMRLDGQEIRSVEGTFNAVSAEIPHEEIRQDRIPRYIAVLVHPDLFDTVWRTVAASPLPAFRGETYPTGERLAVALKEFLVEYESRAPGYEALLATEAEKISLLIARQILGVEMPIGPMSSLLSVNRAVELVNRRYGEKISVGEMAREAHLSVSRFSAVFKDETGVSPAEFVQQVRLDRARRMLMVETDSLTEIALACGFGSSSYFSYCFAGRFGVSPSDFRKSLRS